MAPQINGSVVKAFEILHLFTRDRPVVAAADLVRELGLNNVTAHRFLRTLEHVGALVVEARGHYRLGFVFADLGSRVLEIESIARVVQPVLSALTEAIGEGSMATVLRADKVVCIARALPRRPLSVDVRVGSELEAYCTAHGKLWLAHLPEAELGRYLATVARPVFTATTMVDEAALRAEIASIRKAGYAFNRGEREEGLAAVAVPVLNRAGGMITGLSVFGPAARLDEAALISARDRLRRAAADLEQGFYGTGL
ncbi:IclR family transcriptional regulator [Polymorphum gilvum]|uniref:IclR family transcriptional regulator, pca regulon regulatory protein n=1 Tax=Polymorphum gilvum (strain LMG 25793 / CGMCC 1.9160 / SL003B-26A1) TaxID=991905 RepID=F2IWW3_POLGS|nr:IclR family transcriptional regulator [Polymorphum gilvum]ADZ71540.1 IclR family transcriptional regulator, pca regulon regulatory protein [Polymorphum gilvum SL003B-26A1]